MREVVNSLPESTNPFAPGWGVPPPLLAGRDAMIHRLLAGIYAGPTRPEFHNILVGLRGIGKTVVVNRVIELGAAETRLVHLRWTAPRRLHDAVLGEAAGLRAELTSALRRRLRNVDTVALKAGATGIASGELAIGRARPTPGDDAYRELQELGGLAAQRNRVLVIVADEIHAADPADIQLLAVALQDLTVGRGLPIALLGAGLPSAERTIRSAGATFLARQELTMVRNLSEADTIDALVVPFEQAGRAVDDAAVEQLVEATGGYPYAVQLAGRAAWDAAGEGAVTERVAEAAIVGTRRQLAAQLYESAWSMIRPADQTYVIEVARLAQTTTQVPTRQIAERLGRPPASLSPTRDRLIHDVQVLETTKRGTVQFAIPGLAEWVLHRDTRPDEPRTNLPPG